MPRQIGAGQPFKPAVAQNGAQAGIILVKAILEPKPILPVVNFQTLEGSQAVVGLDEVGGDFFHGPAVGRLGAACRRAGASGQHDGAGHEALQFEEFARRSGA